MEWANYKIDEGKGIMMWGKMTSMFNQLSMGYSTMIQIFLEQIINLEDLMIKD